MAQNNMRKMFTEQQIIDLVKNQNKNVLVCGNFVDVDETIYGIFPIVVNKAPHSKYNVMCIESSGSITDYWIDFKNKKVFQSDGTTEISLDSATITETLISTGEISGIIDI